MRYAVLSIVLLSGVAVAGTKDPSTTPLSLLVRNSVAVVKAEVLFQSRTARIDTDSGRLYRSVTYSWRIRVLEVLHGAGEANAKYSVVLYRVELDDTDSINFPKGTKWIFFLKRAPARHRDGPTHQLADDWFSVQHATTSLAGRVKTLSKAAKRSDKHPLHDGSIAVIAGGPKVDYQKLADRTEFNWRAEESTVLFSLSQMPHEYKFRLDYDPAARARGMSFSFLKNDKVVFTFKGHKHSVFKIHDDVLYYPVFHFSGSGCQVVAYDLKKGKELWNTAVKGIGPVLHSAYRNLITLDVNSDVVSIYGHESFGDYIEFLDRNSGDTVGHRTYNMKFKRKRNSAGP